MLPEAPFAVKDTGNSLPVVLLCRYLHFSPFAQLPFRKYMQTVAKTETFGKVQDELGEAEVRRSQLAGNLAAPIP